MADDSDHQALIELLHRLRAPTPMGGQWGALTDYYHGRFTQAWYAQQAARGRILMRETFWSDEARDGAPREYTHFLFSGAEVAAPWFPNVKLFVELCEAAARNENKTLRTQASVDAVKGAYSTLAPMLTAYAATSTEDVVKTAIAEMQAEMAKYTSHYADGHYTLLSKL